jgi:GLPGLI family protein
MKKILLSLFVAILAFSANAQIFIEKANIEYEITQNIKKTMGSGDWAEMMGDKLPKFKIGYYNLTFAENKSVYKFGSWKEKDKLGPWLGKDDKTIWFNDFNTNKTSVEKDLIGSIVYVEDTIANLEWRLTNENRVIAGFNCKKAVAKMFDSVYVFAFYSEEIMIPAGPASINGLPGAILGVTIPRLFTSWIATKVNVNGVDVSGLKPFTSKKSYTNATLKTFIDERSKDWWNGDDNDESRQQKNRFVWGMLL